MLEKAIMSQMKQKKMKNEKKNRILSVLRGAMLTLVRSVNANQKTPHRKVSDPCQSALMKSKSANTFSTKVRNAEAGI